VLGWARGWVGGFRICAYVWCICILSLSLAHVPHTQIHIHNIEVALVLLPLWLPACLPASVLVRGVCCLLKVLCGPCRVVLKVLCVQGYTDRHTFVHPSDITPRQPTPPMCSQPASQPARRTQKQVSLRCLYALDRQTDNELTYSSHANHLSAATPRLYTPHLSVRQTMNHQSPRPQIYTHRLGSRSTAPSHHIRCTPVHPSIHPSIHQPHRRAAQSRQKSKGKSDE